MARANIYYEVKPFEPHSADISGGLLKEAQIRNANQTNAMNDMKMAAYPQEQAAEQEKARRENEKHSMDKEKSLREKYNGAAVSLMTKHDDIARSLGLDPSTPLAPEVEQQIAQQLQPMWGPIRDSARADGLEAPDSVDINKVRTYLKGSDVTAMRPTTPGQSFEPIQSSSGYYGYDKRSNKATPLMDSTGKKPLMPIRSDLDLMAGKVRVEEDEKRKAKIKESYPKAKATWKSLTRQWDIVDAQLDRALEQVSPYTAGVGAWASVLPATPQKDLKETLETIKANIGFDKLQSLRENSPTGGALGQVSDFENKLLQAVQGSLQQNQSDGQLAKNLKTIKEMLKLLRKDKEAAFNEVYGEIDKWKSWQGKDTEDTELIPAAQKKKIGRFTVEVE